jgi:hypothetical protein
VTHAQAAYSTGMGQELTLSEVQGWTSDQWEQRREEVFRLVREGKLVVASNAPKQPGEAKWLRDMRQRLNDMSPAEYESERQGILAQLDERRHRPERFAEEDEHE